jgi:hypothetical protein
MEHFGDSEYTKKPANHAHQSPPSHPNWKHWWNHAKRIRRWCWKQIKKSDKWLMVAFTAILAFYACVTYRDSGAIIGAATQQAGAADRFATSAGQQVTKLSELVGEVQHSVSLQSQIQQPHILLYQIGIHRDGANTVMAVIRIWNDGKADAENIQIGANVGFQPPFKEDYDSVTFQSVTFTSRITGQQLPPSIKGLPNERKDIFAEATFFSHIPDTEFVGRFYVWFIVKFNGTPVPFCRYAASPYVLSGLSNGFVGPWRECPQNQ